MLCTQEGRGCFLPVVKSSNSLVPRATDKTCFCDCSRVFIRAPQEHSSSDPLFVNSDLLIDQLDYRQEGRATQWHRLQSIPGISALRKD